MSAVFLAGLGLLALAAAVDLTGWRSRAAWLASLPYALGAAASGCLLAAGAGALAGQPLRIGLGTLLALDPSRLAADPLSGLFLVVSFGVAVPVSLGFAGWARQHPASRGLGAAYAFTLGAVAVVLTAGDVFVLLLAWEALTFGFYLLACFERRRAGRIRASLVTFAFGKVSGAFLLLGLLLLAAGSGSIVLDSFSRVPAGGVHAAAYVLLVLGFGVKVGLVPLQVWMPDGYAAAPGPARAVMAGVAVNVGFYGLWRTLALLGAPPVALTMAVLLLAGFTALLGIAHAAVQTDLNRVVAYSSVENAGLILVGYGVALVGAGVGDSRLVAVGVLAGTLQVFTHAVAKSLLFTAGATITSTYRTSELDKLRGVATRLPWSGYGFALGAFTLAGLPPTVGFVSEWFLLESLMQQFRLPGLALKLVLALAGAAVALTAGFAGVTFARLVGLTALGPARRRGPSRRLDAGLAGRVGFVMLGTGCLAVAALTPLEVRVVGRGLSAIVPADVTLGALKGSWIVQPVYPEFSILSPSWLWLALPAMALLVAACTFAMSGARPLRVRRVPAWRSATGGVEGADQYTPFGYTNPTRRVLANVLRTRTELRSLPRGGAAVGQSGPIEEGRQDDPAGTEAYLGYTSDVVEVVEAYLYRPLLRPVRGVAGAARRLQSGRLEAYIAYMLIALVGLLAVVTALA